MYSICGDMRTMPGPPEHPAAEHIHIDETGLSSAILAFSQPLYSANPAFIFEICRARAGRLALMFSTNRHYYEDHFTIRRADVNIRSDFRSNERVTKRTFD